MKDLSAERFAQLILSLSARRFIERSRENRSEQRSGVRYRIMIKVPGTRATRLHRAWIRDFSTTGFGMATTISMSKGQAFAIQMHSSDGLMDIPCTTTHCIRVAEDVYKVGARFIDRWYKHLVEAA